MKCSKCQHENQKEDKFCRNCGTKLLLTCPQCKAEVHADDKFCGKCGQKIEQVLRKKEESEIEGERKYITVLFSDLSGYTAMSEKLDPEEVKDIMSRIFGEIAQVVTKYEGFIEKFVGDAVMALFGVPKVHEDDPVRAILAAREIHNVVEAMSAGLEEKIGRSISMHTGINTGLVVTGEVNIEKGTHGVTGDTINMASRLQDLSKKGEILVGQDTYRQAEGHFSFEPMEPSIVKGKADLVQVYKVLSQKEKPVTTHRLSGLRAKLTGRNAEMSELKESVQNLRKGKGTIFSICGDAGTGKSRIVEEFKEHLDPGETQWIEGHAYAYSQNIPYFLVTDLLNRILQIDEGDPPETMRGKIESGVESLVGKKENIIPYIGTLYSLNYPEVEKVSPEYWKSQLKESILTILTALAEKSPTIFFLEDLHWADPSTVELLRNALQDIRQPAIVICVYRPVFSLFKSHQLGVISKIYHEIQLQDLSLSDAESMLKSLLGTDNIPSDLRKFIQEKAEGNPFYLEELINSLIDSKILTRDNSGWEITKPISESEISLTIHGLISGRLDRLERVTKRIVQEASVIGRVFLYDILKKVTELEDCIDKSLNTLERLDLIRTRSIQPDIEYMFKHPLTQEVVYKSLLKKERQTIHEEIATVMERLFQDRLIEFCETLAFHFKQGHSIQKAAHYLVISGEKSLRRYAVEESHRYFLEAFNLLSTKSERTKEEDSLLIDLLMKWALVFYYRGDFKELINLLNAHKNLAETLGDEVRLGMYLAWQGWSLYNRHQYKDSYRFLCDALAIGEKIKDQKLIGYACGWLAWTCTILGPIDDGIRYGERALKITESLPSDQYLYFKTLGAIGYAYSHKGVKKGALHIGNTLLDYGKKHSNIRSTVLGYFIKGYAHFVDMDLISAIEASREASHLAADPYYFQFSNVLLGAAYTQNGQYQEAEHILQDALSFSNEYGCENAGMIASATLGLVMIAKGQMNQGLRRLEDALKVMIESGNRAFQLAFELYLGQIYLRIINRSTPIKLPVMIKNISFIVKNFPSAGKKAHEHFTKAIEVAQEIGANGSLGKAYLGLGILHMTRSRVDQAQQYISEAIGLFEKCEFEEHLKQAKEALAFLNKMDF